MEAERTVCETALALRTCSSSALELELSRPDANRIILCASGFEPQSIKPNKLGTEYTKSRFITSITLSSRMVT